jgi:fatty acid desaturase
LFLLLTGGKGSILNVGGREVTDMVIQYHIESAWKNRCKSMYVGELESRVVKKAGSDKFTEDCRLLEQRLDKDGWYKVSSAYYVNKFFQVFCLFVLAWLCVLLGYKYESVALQLVGGAMIGLFWQQVNFLGHDAGHGTVFFQNRKANSKIGILVGNVLTGLSIGWWKFSHYTHHVCTNVHTIDADIKHLPIFAISTKFFTAAGQTSGQTETNAFYWRLCQFIVGFQPYLYYPVMSVARVNLHIQSIIHILFFEKVENRAAEAAGLVIFWVWWIYMLSFLPSWPTMLCFWYASHAVVGLIHIQICLSHFIMDVFDAVPLQRTDESVFEFQLRTTLDVDCPEWLDWLHGGLQFQALHHMFPRLPRHRLRKVQPLVQALCDKHGIKYHRYAFMEANVMTVKHMYAVARASRNGTVCLVKDSLIFHGFNAIG